MAIHINSAIVDVYEFDGKKFIVFRPDITGVRKVVPVLTSVDCFDSVLDAYTDPQQQTATIHRDIITMYTYLYKAAIRKLMDRVEEALTCD